MDAQKQADFHEQFKQLHKSHGVFKIQQLEKDQTAYLSKETGITGEDAKAFDTSIKIGLFPQTPSFLLRLFHRKSSRLFSDIAMRLIFIKNPAIKDFEEVKNLIYQVLSSGFKICSNADLFKKFMNSKSSSAEKAMKTSERLMKMYKRWQDDLFQMLWVILVLGSPSHTLKALDFHPSPFFNGKICPPLGTAELVQNRKTFLGFCSVKL